MKKKWKKEENQRQRRKHHNPNLVYALTFKFLQFFFILFFLVSAMYKGDNKHKLETEEKSNTSRDSLFGQSQLKLD